MKRIIIICEGPTEIEFCKDVLYPYFFSKNILIQTPLIKKSGGGIVRWENLKQQIENHLLQDSQAFVTMFIDYYGIPGNYHYPAWQAAHLIVDKNQRMETLEEAMKESINANINYRFIPYLQLHEFEGLLFNNLEVFTTHIPEDELIGIEELAQTIQNNPNPEMINDTPKNAPSYRLKRLIRGYNKIVYGSILAKEIGLHNIRTKSPRFNEWIEKLEKI